MVAPTEPATAPLAAMAHDVIRALLKWQPHCCACDTSHPATFDEPTGPWHWCDDCAKDHPGCEERDEAEAIRTAVRVLADAAAVRGEGEVGR